MGKRIGAVVATLLLAACSPTLDWREFRPAGALLTLFPCKPATQARSVKLAGRSVQLVLHACAAAEVTWALATADVVDPSSVTPALGQLVAAAQANLAGVARRVRPFDVPGATPNSAAIRLEVSGRLPDGRQVVEHLGVFALATRVVQVTALGAEVDAEGLATFFESVRVRP